MLETPIRRQRPIPLPPGANVGNYHAKYGIPSLGQAIDTWFGMKRKRMNLSKIPDDWACKLILKRLQGRRMNESGPPPYVTGNGLVEVDRRSQHDRRKPLAVEAAPE